VTTQEKLNHVFLNLEARTRRFWRRVSGGLHVHELWSQLQSEAQAGYRLYSRDVQADTHKDLPTGGFARFWAITRAFFWAILMKLSPARRVLLLIALIAVFFPNFRVHPANGDGGVETNGFAFFGALVLLLLLVMEIADRVTMKRDLQIAREIQLWLVPTVVPELPGLDVSWMNRPQNTVAGDYYDVFTRDTVAGRRVLLVVADVAGKSIPAALLMATFQASLKTLCATPCTLLELANGLNRYSCAHSREGERFTTAFLAEFDPVSGALEYINAGHNRPLLRDASGALSKLEEGGLPFGIVPGTKFEVGRKTLTPGDLLLIYTDGLVEAVDMQGQEFGEPRTIAWITGERVTPDARAKDALDRLTALLQAFVGMAVQHDDITCLLVRRTSN
jgi:phosphoserine phosphatase RsbU/P